MRMKAGVLDKTIYGLMTVAAAMSVAACVTHGSRAVAASEDECITGYDVGSSGIRVGSTAAPGSAKVNIDYLDDVWKNGTIKTTIDPTIDALRTLPKTAGLPETCTGVAGGYSAWRLAAEKNGAGSLVPVLSDIRERSGVSLFVIPQDIEGGYAHLAAARALGSKLTTPFILDIGGGSLQFAAKGQGWGAALGQKSWRKLFCEKVKGATGPDSANCAPNPVGPQAVSDSEKTLAPLMQDAKAKLGQGLKTTAVSAVVVRSIFPILRFLAEEKNVITASIDDQSFSRAALDQAIAYLSDKNDAELIAALDGCRETLNTPICRPKFAAVMVTDMLLVRSLMAGLKIDRLEVAEADVTNVPGILADGRVREWSKNYACYLDRLSKTGVDALKTDPATCP